MSHDVSQTTFGVSMERIDRTVTPLLVTTNITGHTLLLDNLAGYSFYELSFVMLTLFQTITFSVPLFCIVLVEFGNLRH